MSTLKDAGQPAEIEVKKILQFTSRVWTRGHRWNGRQIKNTCKMALALARQESGINTVVLKSSHFSAVAQVNASFSQYLVETRGAGDEDLALQLGLRKDDFDQSAKPIRFKSALESDEDMDTSTESDDSSDYKKKKKTRKRRES
ncbi:hypothetical protein ACEPPN_019494 [Leptodophora sp. 'Broadleaf-Isolate-01']